MQFILDSSVIKSQKTSLKLIFVTLCMLSPCAVVEGVLQRWQLEVEAAVCVKACILSEHAKGKLVPTNEIRY